MRRGTLVFHVNRVDHATEPYRWQLGRVGFGVTAFLLEVMSIVALSVATGALYHLFAYGGLGMIDFYARLGFLAACFYTLPFVLRNEYQFQDYLEGRKSTGRITWMWGFMFACLAIIGFMTKTTESYSRGWVAMFFVTGPVVLMLVTLAIQHALKRLIDVGRIEPRRLMLVGDNDEIAHFEEQMRDNDRAVRIVSTVALPFRGLQQETEGTLKDLQAQFDDAVARARMMHVDDVIIFSDWSNQTFAERALAAFRVLPAAIHIGATDIVGRARKAEICRFADVTTLSLTVPPLSAVEAFTKRAFDVIVSSLALMLLSPMMLAISACIKWETAGPVFFRQRRRGFNHQEFRICKFRTMTTLDDGETIVQATKGDARVTKVGRTLRRWNLDELPQLINVLKGEMSLVGPRPHAVAHDAFYEKRLLTYPRRLNMRPGITGWAQVNGLRGVTADDDAMQQRLDYDLHYIDNWSLWLDLYILGLTILSPKAYRNAL